jgi:hypothetical protein
MIGSYYLWKWADNDLPGKPNEVFAALLRGEMHPALQTFDARPLLRRLRAFAASRLKQREEWYWEVNPSDQPACARFVFLAGPQLNESRDVGKSFDKVMAGLGISGYDEHYGHVIHMLLPKRNCIFFGGDSLKRHYDIADEDVPTLIQWINRRSRDPFAVLEDRRNWFVQCYARGRRFIVEWRENYDPLNPADFNQWRASLIAPEPRNGIEANTIPYADTVAIFQAFVRGDPKPDRYHWRNLNREIELAGHSQSKETAHDK